MKTIISFLVLVLVLVFSVFTSCKTEEKIIDKIDIVDSLPLLVGKLDPYSRMIFLGFRHSLANEVPQIEEVSKAPMKYFLKNLKVNRDSVVIGSEGYKNKELGIITGKAAPLYEIPYSCGYYKILGCETRLQPGENGSLEEKFYTFLDRLGKNGRINLAINDNDQRQPYSLVDPKLSKQERNELLPLINYMELMDDQFESNFKQNADSVSQQGFLFIGYAGLMHPYRMYLKNQINGFLVCCLPSCFDEVRQQQAIRDGLLYYCRRSN